MRHFDVRFTSAPVENWVLRRIGLELAGGRVPSPRVLLAGAEEEGVPGDGGHRGLRPEPAVSMFVTLAAATSVTTPFPFTV